MMLQTSQGFQTQVNVEPGRALAGDFASTNPRNSMLAGPAGIIAGVGGVQIGRAVWVTQAFEDGDFAPASATNGNPLGGPISGITHRGQQGLITTYLGASSYLVPAGFGIEVIVAGDIWVKNEGTGQCLPGMNAYASFLNGAFSFASGTASPGTATVTGSIGPQTASFTGVLQGNQLTVSAMTSGTLQVGATVTGTAGVTSGTQIVAQLSGTIGGVGIYSVTIPEQNVVSSPMSATYGLLNVTAVTSGTLAVGDLIAGSGVTVGTVISALGTGTGGVGTYIVQNTQTVGSITITANTSVATKWLAMSAGNAGELVKISSTPLG